MRKVDPPLRENALFAGVGLLAPKKAKDVDVVENQKASKGGNLGSLCFFLKRIS